MRPRHEHTTPWPPPVSGVRDHEETAARDAVERAPKISTRRARSSRPPIRVDEVGDIAVAIAARAVETSAPKLVATRASLTEAPIDSRDAFVISLVDGRTPLSALVDASGMPGEDVRAILARLARLGLVAF